MVVVVTIARVVQPGDVFFTSDCSALQLSNRIFVGVRCFFCVEHLLGLLFCK